MRKVIAIFLLFAFISTSVQWPSYASQVMPWMPAPGSMVNISSNFEPALIRGLTVHRDNPFLFDFIIDPGQSKLSGQALKDESDRMIKYFFASLTIPDKDIWVNLSPYEKDRMIPQTLGETAMGRDLLAQDYMLKQLTASLIYPQKSLGKEFWAKVYAKAKEMYGTTQIPVNTFNKVWIVPQKVGIYEHGQTAFIVDGHLKVMLEEDYLSLTKHNATTSLQNKNDTHEISSQIIRQIILPEIEKEVNNGKNFATLRQIFYAQALAVWFKRNLKQALLNRVYANKGTVKGIDQNDVATNEAIYQQYLKAYKKGVFNFIKEDINPITQENMPRKYFSGGYGKAQDLAVISESVDQAQSALDEASRDHAEVIEVLAEQSHNAAMVGPYIFDDKMIREAKDSVLQFLARNTEQKMDVVGFFTEHGHASTIDTIQPIIESVLQYGKEHGRPVIFSLENAGVPINSDSMTKQQKRSLVDEIWSSGKKPLAQKQYEIDKKRSEYNARYALAHGDERDPWHQRLHLFLKGRDNEVIFEQLSFDSWLKSKRFELGSVFDAQRTRPSQILADLKKAILLYRDLQKARDISLVDDQLRKIAASTGPAPIVILIRGGEHNRALDRIDQKRMRAIAITTDNLFAFPQTAPPFIWLSYNINNRNEFSPDEEEFLSLQGRYGALDQTLPDNIKSLATFEDMFRVYRQITEREFGVAYLDSVQNLHPYMREPIVIIDNAMAAGHDAAMRSRKIVYVGSNEGVVDKVLSLYYPSYRFGPTIPYKVLIGSKIYELDPPRSAYVANRDLLLGALPNSSPYFTLSILTDDSNTMVIQDRIDYSEELRQWYDYRISKGRPRIGNLSSERIGSTKLVFIPVFTQSEKTYVVGLVREEGKIAIVVRNKEDYQFPPFDVFIPVKKENGNVFKEVSSPEILSQYPFSDFENNPVIREITKRMAMLLRADISPDRVVEVAEQMLGITFGNYLSPQAASSLLDQYRQAYPNSIGEISIERLASESRANARLGQEMALRVIILTNPDQVKQVLLDVIFYSVFLDAAMRADPLATRLSNGKPIRLIISDLTGTLVLLFEDENGKQHAEPISAEFREKWRQRLEAGGVLTIVTGDRFNDARDWFINQLGFPPQLLSRIVVLSQTGMLGHRYDPVTGEWEVVQDAATDHRVLNETQLNNWDEYKDLLQTIGIETAEKFFGAQEKITKDDDGAVIYKFEHGSLMLRSHQLTLRVRDGQREVMMKYMREAIERQDADFIGLGFEGTDIATAGTEYIDLPYIPGFNKEKGLELLEESGVLQELLGVSEIPWDETEGLGDSLLGNDEALGRFLHKRGGKVTSVGQKDHEDPRLPEYVHKEEGQIGPDGSLYALSSPGTARININPDDLARLMLPMSQALNYPGVKRTELLPHGIRRVTINIPRYLIAFHELTTEAEIDIQVSNFEKEQRDTALLMFFSGSLGVPGVLQGDDAVFIVEPQYKEKPRTGWHTLGLGAYDIAAVLVVYSVYQLLIKHNTAEAPVYTSGGLVLIGLISNFINFIITKNKGDAAMINQQQREFVDTVSKAPFEDFLTNTPGKGFIKNESPGWEDDIALHEYGWNSDSSFDSIINEAYSKNVGLIACRIMRAKQSERFFLEIRFAHPGLKDEFGRHDPRSLIFALPNDKLALVEGVLRESPRTLINVLIPSNGSVRNSWQEKIQTQFIDALDKKLRKVVAFQDLANQYFIDDWDFAMLDTSVPSRANDDESIIRAAKLSARRLFNLGDNQREDGFDLILQGKLSIDDAVRDFPNDPNAARRFLVVIWLAAHDGIVKMSNIAAAIWATLYPGNEAYRQHIFSKTGILDTEKEAVDKIISEAEDVLKRSKAMVSIKHSRGVLVGVAATIALIGLIDALNGRVHHGDEYNPLPRTKPSSPMMKEMNQKSGESHSAKPKRQKVKPVDVNTAVGKDAAMVGNRADKPFIIQTAKLSRNIMASMSAKSKTVQQGVDRTPKSQVGKSPKWMGWKNEALKVSFPKGGIDLSRADAAMHITKDANGGVKVDVDPAEIAHVERYGLSEVDPVIIGMRPADIASIFGVKIPA